MTLWPTNYLNWVTTFRTADASAADWQLAVELIELSCVAINRALVVHEDDASQSVAVHRKSASGSVNRPCGWHALSIEVGRSVGEPLCWWCHSAQWHRYWGCVPATWCDQSFSDIAYGTDRASLCGACKVSKLRNRTGVLSVSQLGRQLSLFWGRSWDAMVAPQTFQTWVRSAGYEKTGQTVPEPLI